MVWQDILIDRKLSKAELTEAICTVFNISTNEVLIVKSITDIEVNNSVRIICQTLATCTTFELLLSIFIRDELLVPSNDVLVISRFCELLKCTVLMSDDSENPHSMLLVKGIKTIERISINLEDYENVTEIELQ